MYAFSLSLDSLSLYITQTHSPIFSPFVPHPRGRDAGKVARHGCWDFDETGKDISEAGVPGELVCTRPHPRIYVCFWGDDTRRNKFLKAYYDTYPGIWRRGDFIAVNPRTKVYVILGRRCVRVPLLACAKAEVSQRRRAEPIGRALWFG
jgi:acyl-coenzyme A synthetase/AMP-(fatty) acid ligase